MTKAEAIQRLQTIDKEIRATEQKLSRLKSDKHVAEIECGTALTPYPIGTRFRDEDRIFEVRYVKAMLPHIFGGAQTGELMLQFGSELVKADGTLSGGATTYKNPSESNIVAADTTSRKVPMLIQVVGAMKKAGIEKADDYTAGYLLYSRGKECRGCVLRGRLRNYHRTPIAVAELELLAAKIEPILTEKGFQFTREISGVDTGCPNISYSFIGEKVGIL